MSHWNRSPLFDSITGQGVRGEIRGQRVLLGNSKLLQDAEIDCAVVDADARAARELGQTVMPLSIDQRIAGLIGVADPIKPTTVEGISKLRTAGVQIVVLTGDNAVTVGAVAKQLGLDDVQAEMLSDDKFKKARALQAAGRNVATAGDGINDAPALAQADVGIAMGTGTDVAMHSGRIVLIKGDLRGIAKARILSRQTMRNIRQNLFFAFVYNFIGVPIAAGVLYPTFSILLSPILASAGMSLSSVCVVGNAARLHRATL